VARRFRHWDALVEVVNGFPYFTPLWWRRPRVCVFNHVHGAQWQMHFPKPVAAAGWFVESEVIPRLYRRTQFATISPSTATDLSQLGVARTRIHPLQLGLDDRLFSEPGRKSREPLFVVVSRLTPNKRVGTVLDAWERVRPRTGGRLVVIGDGPEMEALKARDVPGVDFVGFVTEEEKLALVDRAWLLLHAAANEGWGLVVMEAAARRTPSLAFDVNGVRDAVVDGVTGVLVDSPQALADRWAALVVDRPGLELMGDAARARALEFTWDRTTTELLDVIRGSKGRQR
jgi:glycosyltransferase involved in cell wall biosynthesis